MLEVREPSGLTLATLALLPSHPEVELVEKLCAVPATASRCRRDDWFQIEEAIRNVDEQQATRGQHPGVAGECLARHQVHRHRIRRKRIKRQQVERGGTRPIEIEPRIAQHDRRMRQAKRKKRELVRKWLPS
ncbi:hypothetical protein BLX87_23990 [Bacillus sp. VT-16-64]|nr:hypothetical protein BLX87_23990 [Bacillus sp. VT-16-64]